MEKEKILVIDALINFILGILLLAFSGPVVDFLGVPPSEQTFYPNILGAVFIGITIALLMEYYKKPGGMTGLGLGGAISINICGGIVLMIWLASGYLSIPLRGHIFLWFLAIALVVISLYEYLMFRKKS